MCLLVEFGVTTIAHTDLLGDAEMRQRHRLGGALLIEHLTAVATVMLAVREGEGGSAAKADV